MDRAGDARLSASRMKAATFSSAGGSQSSLGSRVSFQWSQICRASSVSRLTSGKPCARANRSAPCADEQAMAAPLHDQPGDGRRVHDVADRGHRAAAVGRPVHDGGIELDDAVLVGQSAQPTEWSLGSASTMATPSIAASSGSCPVLTSSIAFSTARSPLALETAIGRLAAGRLDRRGADRQRAQARRGRRGHEATSAHRFPHADQLRSTRSRPADTGPRRRGLSHDDQSDECQSQSSRLAESTILACSPS